MNKNWSKDEIREYLISDEKCNPNSIDIKVELNNAKFRTKRLIVMLDQDDTLRIVKKGYVKMSFLIHPVEATYKVIQCEYCLNYGHYYKDKSGRVKCRKAIENKAPTCKFCAKDHLSERCPDKNDNSKRKCAKCDSNQHHANSFKCKKRKETYDNLKNLYIC